MSLQTRLQVVAVLVTLVTFVSFFRLSNFAFNTFLMRTDHLFFEAQFSSGATNQKATAVLSDRLQSQISRNITTENEIASENTLEPEETILTEAEQDGSGEEDPFTYRVNRTLPPREDLRSKPLVIAYCTYEQKQKAFEPLGQSHFIATFFGNHVFPERRVEYRPCVALAAHLPPEIEPSSQEGLKRLGLTSDVDIRVCPFGASDILNVLKSVPGVELISHNAAYYQERLKSLGMWWTDNPALDPLPERWSHNGRLHWAKDIAIAVNKTTRRPFGPFFARHNKEPWFESVKGSPAQFDTKRTALPIDSVTIYWPMLLDTMGWRLTGDKYPNHWSSRVGKARYPVETLAQIVSRPRNYNATAVRLSKRFFVASVHSHCGGPGAYLRSVTIRELMAFSIYRLTNRSVHFSGACPLLKKERGGPADPAVKNLRHGSAVDFMTPHKFTLAFENSQTPGYITEKIANAYLAESIPVYFGVPPRQSRLVLNEKAFIHCDLPSGLVNNKHLHELAGANCPSGNIKTTDCYALFEAALDAELRPHLEVCVRKILEIERDHQKYEAMLKEPLATMDERGNLIGLWSGKEMGTIIRVLMAAFGYIDGP